MLVSMWWVVVAASLGLCAGMLLFAVLTIASDREDPALPDAQEPWQALT